jgi:uncharacterized protein YecE (DUF72 family)
VAARWCERVREAPTFRFGAKIHRKFTHEREAYGAAEVAEARAALDRLQAEGRLGAALLQFPWSFRRGEAEEEWLRGLFRALEELAAAGVGIVNVDQPRFHGSRGPGAEVTAAVAYVRVHGRNYRDWFRKDAGRDARYDYLYGAGQLEPWAERVREMAASPRAPEVYVVTNNHFRGQAPANAAMLQAMVEERRVEVPPELLAAFPEALGPYATARTVRAP